MDHLGSITKDLQKQADRDLARRSAPGVLAYLMLWGIVAAFGKNGESHPVLVELVGGAYLVLGAFRLAWAWRFDRLHARFPRLWRRLFVLGTLLSAGVWGGFSAYILGVEGLADSSMLILLSSAGIAAGASVSLAPLGRMLWFQLALLLWPSIPLGLASGHALGLGTALMVLTYYIFLGLSGRQLHAEYWRALRQSAEMEKLAESAERGRRLHAAVGSVLNRYVQHTDRYTVFDELLQHCIDLTGSEYGFISEVLRDPEGKPYLKSFALTNIAWSDEWRATYAKYAPQGMEFHNLETLFGSALVTGQPVIANDPSNDPRSGGLPPGHPAMHAFLGMPLFLGDHLVGMIGLANRKGGYDQDVVAFMQPLFGTCAQIIEARHNQALRRQAREALNQFKGTLDRTLDCVFMFEPDSLRFFYVNQGAMAQVGYSEQELLAMHPYDIKPRLPEPKFREFIAPLLRLQQEAITFETVHQHKDGRQIPVEVFLQYIAPPGEHARFVAIVRDITERKKMERLKSEFVSTVSHELRTPLTSIRGALGLINSGVAGPMPDKARELLDIAFKNSERLTHLINDILDIEKIESGRMHFELRPHSLRRLAEQAIVANRIYGQQYHVEFRLLPGGADAVANVDTTRFMQVMSNLLSNAAKFSPSESAVEVKVEKNGAFARVSVRDHGSGIPPEFQERIFEKFSQADSSDARGKGGTGLGLSITKAIVEQLGGRIHYETGPRGATFYFDLPAVDMVKRHEISQGVPRILVCEDDLDAAQMIAMMLDQAGFAADVAFNAAQAREALLSGEYQAMTMDLLMPDENGVELIRALRQDERTHDLPIVVVSAIADEGREQLKGGFGIVDWLSKPIDEKRLVSALRMAMPESGAYRPEVLHVEDDADVRRMVATLCTGLADVDPAETIEMARTKLALQRYALVVLDITLPDGSGWELLPTLRALDPPPPVLVLAGEALSTEETRQITASLVKSSTSSEEIIRAIRGLLRR